MIGLLLVSLACGAGGFYLNGLTRSGFMHPSGLGRWADDHCQTAESLRNLLFVLAVSVCYFALASFTMVVGIYLLWIICAGVASFLVLLADILQGSTGGVREKAMSWFYEKSQDYHESPRDFMGSGILIFVMWVVLIATTYNVFLGSMAIILPLI